MTLPANPTQLANRAKARRDGATVILSAAAVAVSIISLVLTLRLQIIIAGQDRQATYNRDILVPTYTRFTTALDGFEQAERADLALVEDTSAQSSGLNARKYTTLLSDVRTAKVQVDLVAPVNVSAIAQDANDRYGAERFCMMRLIAGQSEANFAADRSNRLARLIDLERLREHFVAVARSELSDDTDPLTTVSALPTPSLSETVSTPRADDC